MKPSLVGALAALALAVALPGAPLSPSPPADAAEPTYAVCVNRPPEIVGTEGTVRGTDGNDVIMAGPGTTVLAGSGRDLICTYGGDVKAGSGDDVVVVLPSGTRQTGDLELGQGTDTVDTLGGAAALLDVRHHVVTSEAGRFRIENAEQYYIASDDRVEVRGSAGPDVVWAEGCRIRMHGAGGADLLYPEKALTCGDTGSALVARVYGGAGNDDLRGTTAQDELRGGPGRDAANGVSGYDLCRAEVLRHCDH